MNSADSVVGEGGETFTTEFSNEQNPAQYPPHQLSVKIGAPVVILRNLRSAGVSNGQRATLLGVSPNRRFLSLSITDKVILIPRIDFPLPIKVAPGVQLQRRQFPVRLAFALTIHKSQGQTLQKVVVDVPHLLNPLSPLVNCPWPGAECEQGGTFCFFVTLKTQLVFDLPHDATLGLCSDCPCLWITRYRELRRF